MLGSDSPGLTGGPQRRALASSCSRNIESRQWTDMSLGDSLALMRSRGQGGYSGQVQCNETESLLSISCWRHAESDTSVFFCKPIVRPLMNVPRPPGSLTRGGTTMSAQSTLSRREALSLLGVTSGSAVATTLVAQTAGARSHEVIGTATSTRPQYIFGYGSLIERLSRIGTWPSAQFAFQSLSKVSHGAGSTRPTYPVGARPISVASQTRAPNATA